jgi:hypothetical protein
MKFINLFFCTFLSLILLSSCEKDKDPLAIPTTYESANFATNVATEAGVRSQMSALTKYMKKAEKVENTLTLDSLTYFFSSNGSPSLSSITQGYYKNLIEGSFFQTMVACSGKDYDPANGATATNGGVFGARLLDKRAKETLQEIEKGLFEAALYNHFINLTKGTIDEATVDQMVSIYGAHPNFPNTNTAANTPTPDGFIALYAARRDKADGTGPYTRIRDQFIKLKAAVGAGKDYNEERDQAIADIKLLMEEALMATVIHYGYTGLSKLTTSSPSATTISGGLHDLGEAVGFTHGFKAIPQSERKITDAQIDEILALLLAPAGQDASMYRFVTEGTTALPNITAYQQKIKAIYGFTDAEMEDFKNNWISVQMR